jgi:hypothetical protein
MLALQALSPVKAMNVALVVLLAVCACPKFSLAYRSDIRMHQAAKGVSDSYDELIDLLESIEQLLVHLDTYIKIPPTPAMDEIVVKIMVELLSTLALATKKLRQGQSSKSVFGDVFYLTQCDAVNYVKKRFGEMNVEVVMQRLDRLTPDEARATAMPTLEVVYSLVQNMKVVMNGEQMRLTCHSLSAEYSPL